MIVQGSDEWKQSRVGVVTASRFSDVLAKIRTGEAAIRANYKAEIIAETLTGLPTDSYTSREMQWGIDHEDEARTVYELINDVEVEETGLIKHPGIQAGASPDGLVNADGGIEIKCPNTSTHIKTILGKKIPSQYKAQVQGAMWITGRKWWDFVSFDPRLSDDLAYFCVREYRDEAYIKNLDKEVRIFLNEVNQLIKKLRKQ